MKSTKKPPKRGVNTRDIGATWWGKRWIETVERLSREYLSRLGRGRALARAGRVHALQIAPGAAHARVLGADDEIYEVTLRVAVLPAASWSKVIAAMSKQASFAAELFSWRMPANIDDAFRAAGHTLFLHKQRELESDCTCADWANPCVHVAAVHYVLAEAFDKNPFLLFELRGRSRTQLLNALRSTRAGEDAEASLTEALAGARSGAASNGAMQAAADGEAIPAFSAGDFERSPTTAALTFHMDLPNNRGALLRQLGPPPSWREEDLSFDVLIELYRAAAQRARELALPEAIEPSADARVNKRTTKLRRTVRP